MPVEETLRRAGITGLAEKAYGKLSGGQKRTGAVRRGHLRPSARVVPR
jgi:ABC-type thiamine transport system ATPase subunit